MTKRTEAVPATAGEAAKAPASASKGGGLPVVSGTGSGEWNVRLLNDVVQVCSGGGLGDTAEVRAIAIKKARAGIAAMQGIGREPGSPAHPGAPRREPGSTAHARLPQLGPGRRRRVHRLHRPAVWTTVALEAGGVGHGLD